MAKYTIELYKLVNSGYQIFDETWSTFVPEHKVELCNKIIRKYWFNEIGAETPDRFKHYINEQLAREMPYYNKLYESDLWSLFPLYNYIMESEGHTSTKNTALSNLVSRHDSSVLREMGESLYREANIDKWGTMDSTTHEVLGEVGNLTGDHTEKETIDTSGTKDYTKDQDNKLEEQSERDIKTVEESQEVIDDDTTGHTTQSETTNGTRRYSDTPQGSVTTSGGLSIDAQYLTNYESTNSSRNLTEDTKGTDDRTTNFNKTTTTDDDFNRTVTEDNKETYDEDTTTHSVRDKSNHDVEDTTHNKDTVTTVNQTTHDSQYDNSDEFKQNSEQANGSDVNAQSTSSQTDDSQKTSMKRQGTVGSSRVELLRQYRNSIINIDELIIRSLAENFMGVF